VFKPLPKKAKPLSLRKNHSPVLHPILNHFSKHPLHKEILAGLSEPKVSMHFQGIVASALALHIASVESATNDPVVVIANDHEEAVAIHADLENILGEREQEFFRKHVIFYPAPEKHGSGTGAIDTNNILARTEVLKRLGSDQRRILVVTHAEALSELVVSRAFMQENTFRLKKGEQVDLDFVTDFLIEYGFERVDFVTDPGQFALRGGIVDVYSFSNDFPYRIEFLGDEVASIRSFEPVNQLSKEQVTHITIVPNLQQRGVAQEQHPLFAFIPSKAVVWIRDAGFTADNLNQRFHADQEIDGLDTEEPTTKAQRLSGERFLEEISRYRVIHYGATEPLRYDRLIRAEETPQPTFNKKFDLLRNDLTKWEQEGYTCFVLSDNPKQIERLKNIFSDITEEQEEMVYKTAMPSLHQGFIDHQIKLVCYTDHQIFERYRKIGIDDGYHRREALTIKELINLQPGDFVSHIDHGIGRFDGLETIENNGRLQETVRLIYRNDDVVYVSIHALHRIARYSGSEGTAPRLDRLGSGAWKKLKEKTKSKVKDIARDLIKLYAKRMASEGFAFSPDTYLQHELEASFIYEDTPDQITATNSLKQDMEKPYPMDRLICGDVGFGKTEVAIRAAFKAACDSKQVAILVPTTILALQHYHTLKERLAEFPVTIDYINRFRSAKDQKNTLKRLAEGKLDIIIGTHRLVGGDVKFKDLGLLIIDEEQKFGVSVKEKLKRIRVDVDTLTLTATPIPRTLQFSLMGARDLSVISTPPPNRHPIQTLLRGYSEDLIKEAIHYELNRGGQVFFLHNRIQNIHDIAQMISKLLPGISVAVGHGQMEGEMLEQVMLGFIEGNTDVLVSTSIIESGLDIPNANTMIINDAHMYGLSDLHQLRGRVGRSNKKAFCYLITPPLSVVSTEARKRLRAIEEFSDLGSGFSIAMRDLDIRGAGNILGAEQSGFISEIGYEMYQKILKEAMEELRAAEFPELMQHAPEKQWKPGSECLIETDLEILLPADYVESTAERLLLYRELDDVLNEESLESFRQKCMDRFGPLPPPAEDLVNTIRLRWLAAKMGFIKISLRNNRLSGYFPDSQDHPFFQSEQFGALLEYVKTHPRRCNIKQKNGKLYLTLTSIGSVDDAIKALQEIET
jgi:transcription-repair coupling factor (superfamily II helicase)